MAEQNLKFEDAMSQLEKLVNELEKGEMPLDEALNAFEKGVKLHAQCEEKLKEAEMRVEKVLTKNGQQSTEAFNVDGPQE